MEHNDPEGLARAALFKAWKKLRVSERPKYPRILARGMIEKFLFPYSDFDPKPHERANLEAEADKFWLSITKASNSFYKSVSKHLQVGSDFPLIELLGSRIPDDNIEETHSLICAIGDKIQLLSRKNLLSDRTEKPPFPAIQYPYLRSMVEAVIWYIVIVEDESVKINTDNDGTHMSRAAVLTEVTIKALGHRFPRKSTLRTLIESVRADRSWRASEYNPFRVLPPSAPEVFASPVGKEVK